MLLLSNIFYLIIYAISIIFKIVRSLLLISLALLSVVCAAACGITYVLTKKIEEKLDKWLRKLRNKKEFSMDDNENADEDLKDSKDVVFITLKPNENLYFIK